MITDLALILVVAGAVTLLFKRLRQPLVLGYIVAGFLVSPQMPYTMSVVERDNVQLWADLGVIVLLFSLGLDFSFKKILRMGIAPAVAALVIIFCMVALGYGVAKAFGWGEMDCTFIAGMLAMSSTTIIYKAFDDMGLRREPFTRLVMSVLILEDILAIVMMVMLATIASGSSLDADRMISSVARIGFFLVLWFVVGLFFVPMFLRRSRPLMGDETLLIVSLGLCFAMAVFSTAVGFSAAFGAFVMGSILAETAEAGKIARLVEPVKNLFGAVFFVSVGMLVEPTVIVDYAVPIAVLVLTVLVGQAVFGSLGYLLSGQRLQVAMRCGFSMAQIGEFAFIIASLGLSLGVVGDFLYPVVVAVSVITTFLTPYMIRLAIPCHRLLANRLPGVAMLLDRLTLSRTPAATSRSLWGAYLRQTALRVAIYSIVSIAVVFIMLTFFKPFILHLLAGRYATAYLVCAISTVAVVSPFLHAIMKSHGSDDSRKLLWAVSRRNRLSLVSIAMVRIAVAGGFVAYLFATLCDFHVTVTAALTLAVIVIISMSRHVRRASQWIELTFVQNLRSCAAETRQTVRTACFDIPAGSPWAGKTLRELALRQRFGIHVGSIMRSGSRINIPDGDDMLLVNDKIQVTGNDEQLSLFSEECGVRSVE